MIKPWLFLFILLIGIPANLFSQSSTARFLYWQPSAEITAMGGAGVSLVDNPFAAYYNPASLAFNNSFSAAGSFVQPFPGFENQYNSMISLSQKFGNTGTFALSVNLFSIPAQVLTGPDGPASVSATKKPTNFHIKASFANMITPNLSFGASFGALSTTLGEGTDLFGKSTTVLADAGLLLTNLFTDATWYDSKDYLSSLVDQRIHKGVSVGLSLLNFGPKISFSKYSDGEDPPSTVLLGLNYWPLFTNSIGDMVLLDFEKRIYDSDKLDYIHFGNELLFFRMLSLRAGYVYDNINSTQSYFTYGFGFKMKFFSLNVSHYQKFLRPAWHIDGNINLEL